MNKEFQKLAKEIDFNDPHLSFKNTILTKTFLKNDNFIIYFENPEIIPPNDMKLFLQKLNNNFPYSFKFIFFIKKITYKKTDIQKYLKLIFYNFLENPELGELILNKKQEIIILDNKIKVYFQDQFIYYKFLWENKNVVVKLMQNFGYQNFDIEFIFKNEHSSLLIQEDLLQQKANLILKNNNNNNDLYNNQSSNNLKSQEIANLYETDQNYVKTKGQIFKLNLKKIKKNDWHVLNIFITDHKEAICVNFFAKNEKEKLQISKYVLNSYIEVQGYLAINPYSKEKTINVHKIKIINSFLEEKTDKAKIKRIELNIKTKMSQMDGMISIPKLLKRMEKWNHKAVAISDFNSVQSFPEFYNELKKTNIKGIYGCNFSVINKNVGAIYNYQKNKNLLNDTYIVFDLETTGFYPEFDDIIEFAANKIQNNQIIESKQFFVKPTHPIPKNIQDITNITEKDVETAKNQNEAILDIYNYLKDYTLVAHNANFDITFVNAKLRKYHNKKIVSPVIDTLTVGKMLHPQAKKFKLASLATRYEITYNSKVAHRADYDTNVLTNIWFKMLEELKKENIITQQDLFEYENPLLYKKIFSQNISVLAKNQKGIKKIFQLISKTHTKNYYNGAKIFMNEFKNQKDILIGSGGLKSRLINKMIFGSQDDVKKEIAYYDYIEIQPLQNFVHLFSSNFNEEKLKETLKFVILEAKKQNKIVVATCESRYLNKEDKLLHEIYINAKGLGGKRHYLYKFNDTKFIYPTQDLLNTEEMIANFAFLNNKKLINEIVITNTHKIADMIQEVEIIKENFYAPKLIGAFSKLKKLVYKNAYLIYGSVLPDIILKRMEKELILIEKSGFSVIYWISHLLVKKSLNDKYLVGSRGSVGSSFIATMANITEVNPLEPHYYCKNCQYSEFPILEKKLNSGFDLPDKNCIKCDFQLSKDGQNIPFETFMGFNGNKIPDIDLNFSGDYQLKIHDEVKKIFGDSHVFRAGTISTVANKTAYGYVKSWIEDKNYVFSKSFIEFLTINVAGTKRTSGQHPGGIIVIPKEYSVEDFTPINFPANDVTSSWKTTHFDFSSIHDNVIKLDLLGHDDPTVIKELENLTNINAKNISFNDPKIISLFSYKASLKTLNINPEDIEKNTAAGTIGIPEFGTNFVRKMLKTAKVKSFGDLIAVSGLAHGKNIWINNVKNLIKERKLSLSEVVSCRDDIMIDLLKNNIEPIIAFGIMESVRKGKGVTLDQEKTMIKHGIENWYIDCLKKIEYIFPKAHATAYVMMAWRIAWFKLYKPLAYYATYFTNRNDVFDLETIIQGKIKIKEKWQELKNKIKNKEKITNKEIELISIFEIAFEALSRGIKISNISLKKSHAIKWLIDKENNTIIPPFISLDGLGITAANSIIKEREIKFFSSIQDLKTRTILNKTNMEKMEELKIFNNLPKSNQITFSLF